MNKKLLVVVDMQNDFVTGALPNTEAQKFVPDLVEYIKKFDGDVIFTKDTHNDENYMDSQEGKKLPVMHCVRGTEGWELIPELKALNVPESSIVIKPTFGSVKLANWICNNGFDEVYFCGVCTGICVISNVALVKAFCPNTPVKVIEDLCACVTPETHKTAIDSMRTFQVDIINKNGEPV